MLAGRFRFLCPSAGLRPCQKAHTVENGSEERVSQLDPVSGEPHFAPAVFPQSACEPCGEKQRQGSVIEDVVGLSHVAHQSVFVSGRHGGEDQEFFDSLKALKMARISSLTASMGIRPFSSLHAS